MSPVPLKMNLQETCRLCLGQGGVLSPIFQESVGGGEGCRQSQRQRAPQPQPALPLRIMACAPIRVIEGDDLPAQICHRCLYQVERSYDFKEQCETSDRVLRQYVAQMQMTVKEEPNLGRHSPARPGFDDASSGSTSIHLASIKGSKINQSSEDKIVLSTSIEGDFLKMNMPAEVPIHKEVKINVLQSKLSAIIHQQAPMVLPEEDVDSGLLESLADSDDLQIVGSEGENVPMSEGEGQKFDQIHDDADKSESSEEEIRLRCKMCKDTFPNVGVLEIHEAAHEVKGPPYSCSICEKTFVDRSNLDVHWLVHTGENPSVCPVCEGTYANEDSLESHLTSHQISLPFFCATCDKSFALRADLQKHTLIHSGLRPFKCKICPQEFARSISFNKHLRMHSGQKAFSCNECPKMFRTKGDLHRHEIIHTGQKPFSCPLCNLSFNRKDKLTRHERLHAAGKVFGSSPYSKSEDVLNSNLLYSGDEQPVQEAATDLSMPSKKEAQLAESMDFNEDDSTVDTEPDNRLQICEDPIDEDMSDGQGSVKLEINDDKQMGVESMVISLDPFQMERMDPSAKESDLPSNFSLNSVKSEFEKEEYSPNENDVEDNIQENTKPYPCEFCPKKFADKSYMKTHQLTHLGIRPHACSYCGKGFFRRRELLRHEAVHTGIKPFTCKTCNKAFARSDKLMRHERTHGQPKNFSCPECPAVFSRKDELSRHRMCHTGERPHCCSQCFKSFFSRAELTRHEKTHGGLKPFKCDYCDQSFHRRDKLNRHVRTHMSMASQSTDTNVLGTVHLHDLLAAHCGQHFAAEVHVKEEKSDMGDDLKVRSDGSIDARALARLNQNPDIHLIPLKQN